MRERISIMPADSSNGTFQFSKTNTDGVFDRTKGGEKSLKRAKESQGINNGE